VTAWTTPGLAPESYVLLLDATDPAGEGCDGTPFAYGRNLTAAGALAAVESLASSPVGKG
jgi:hypothetical protein